MRGLRRATGKDCLRLDNASLLKSCVASAKMKESELYVMNRLTMGKSSQEDAKLPLEVGFLYSIVYSADSPLRAVSLAEIILKRSREQLFSEK